MIKISIHDKNKREVIRKIGPKKHIKYNWNFCEGHPRLS